MNDVNAIQDGRRGFCSAGRVIYDDGEINIKHFIQRVDCVC